MRGPSYSHHNALLLFTETKIVAFNFMDVKEI